MLGWNVRWISGGMLVASIGVGAAARGDVLVVDMNAGPFHEIQEAVLAAQDGDTILVRPAPGFLRYQGIEIAGKALTIAVDSAAGMARVRSVTVRDLPAGKTVVLSRLEVIQGFIGVPPSIWLHDNAGSVRLVACTSTGGPWDAAAGLGIESSSGSTALAACTLTGGAGGGGDEVDGFPGAAGLELEDALAAFYDCTITGGEGGFLYIADHAGPGGAGALAAQQTLPTRLFLANSSVQGGPGGFLFWCLFGTVSGDGGPGLALGAGTSATRLETTIAGGAGGALPGCGTSGATGQALVGPGVLVGNPTSALRLTTPTVAREQQTIALTFDGTPGDDLVLFCGLQTTYREWADGVQLVRPGGVPFFTQRGPIGTLDSSGTFGLELTLPELPAGLDALDLWFQALAVHADGKRTLGSFAVVTVVDSRF